MAESIFHELSHQQTYIENNADFNEAFATLVGDQSTLLWLQQAHRSKLLRHHKFRLSVRADFINLVVNTKNKLDKLYKSSLLEKIKRPQKQIIFELIRRD